MKQLHMFLGTLVLILTANTAHAERFMLVYKNERAFSQVHSSWVLSPTPKARQIFSLAEEPQANIEIEESLSHVQSIVVDSDDVTALLQITQNQDVTIEREVFYPAPRPVYNYEPTQAWDFAVNYSVDHEILARKRKTSPKAPQTGADQTFAAGPKTPWGILNVKAMEAWADSNQGLGARVLVLDTGLDIDHPAFKGQVEDTKDFVGDHQEPIAVADKVGHGTHVAGTILAATSADGFTGVAPKAKLLAGRVCSDEGCSSIAVVQGINWGIEKKVDVINLSLGSDFGSNSEKNAVEKAEKAGIVVVAASGNDEKPQVGYPAAYPTVIAVGAIDDKNKKADFSQWGPQLDIVAPGVDVESSVPMGTGCQPKVSVLMPTAKAATATCFSGSAYLSSPLTKTLVYAGLGKPEDFKGLDMTNKFALIERGEILFSDKVEHALAANAAGVVIYNNKPGLMSGAITEDGSILAIPVVMIEQTMGQNIRKSLEAGTAVEVAITTEKSDYSVYNGTSMASPHVAGVVALIRATNKALTPEQIRNMLKESTTLIKDDAGNAQNWYGAGAVNAENAVAKAVQLR